MTLWDLKEPIMPTFNSSYSNLSLLVFKVPLNIVIVYMRYVSSILLLLVVCSCSFVYVGNVMNSRTTLQIVK